MTNLTLLALACAGVLGLSACAHEPWQPPQTAHPADPEAESGSYTPITSLQRYRGSEDEMQRAPSTRKESEEEADEDEHQHGEHAEEHL